MCMLPFTFFRAQLESTKLELEEARAGRVQAEERGVKLSREITGLREDLDRLTADLRGAQVKARAVEVLKRDYEEADANRRKLTTDLDREKQSRIAAEHAATQSKQEADDLLAKLKVLLKAPPLGPNQPPREVLELRTQVEARLAEIEKLRSDLTLASDELRVIKVSQVAWLSSENERLRRKAVETSRLLSVEQELCAKLSTEAADFRDAVADKVRFEGLLNSERREFSSREIVLNKKVADLTAQVTLLTKQVEHWEGIKHQFKKADIFEGLSAMQKVFKSIDDMASSNPENRAVALSIEAPVPPAYVPTNRTYAPYVSAYAARGEDPPAPAPLTSRPVILPTEPVRPQIQHVDPPLPVPSTGPSTTVKAADPLPPLVAPANGPDLKLMGSKVAQR